MPKKSLSIANQDEFNGLDRALVSQPPQTDPEFQANLGEAPGTLVRDTDGYTLSPTGIGNNESSTVGGTQDSEENK